jgi:hypothetical protein
LYTLQSGLSSLLREGPQTLPSASSASDHGEGVQRDLRWLNRTALHRRTCARAQGCCLCMLHVATCLPVPRQCPPSPTTLNKTPTEASTPETNQTASSTKADSMDDLSIGPGLEEAPGLMDAAVGLEPEGLPPSLSASFINNFTHPAARPLLQQHQQATSSPKKRGKHGVRPVHWSKWLVAVVWPRDNIQERARQVLMKRLGILPSISQPTAAANGEAALEHYINLFKGPLTTVALQALLPSMESSCSGRQCRELDHAADYRDVWVQDFSKCLVAPCSIAQEASLCLWFQVFINTLSGGLE